MHPMTSRFLVVFAASLLIWACPDSGGDESSSTDTGSTVSDQGEDVLESDASANDTTANDTSANDTSANDTSANDTSANDTTADDTNTQPDGDGLDADFVTSQQQRVTTPEASIPDRQTLTAGGAMFTFELYQAIREGEANLFYSPHSIRIALAMTYAGAMGDTATEMASVLNFQSFTGAMLHTAFNWLDLELATRNVLENPEDGDGFTLRVVNAFWGQRDFAFLETFLDTLALNYGAGMYQLDFVSDPEGARETINAWVEEQTEDRIQDLLPQGSITPLTRLVLTNAIYFFAPWQFPFEPEDTADGTFTNLGGADVTVPMMSQGALELPYVDTEGYFAVEMPYNGRNLSMFIVVPDDGAFETFEAGLGAQVALELEQSLRSTNMNLSMPKFEFEAELDLASILAEMGMPSAFDSGSANFEGMTGTRELFITGVLHKAFVSVNEEGTEAAAATAVIIGTTSVPPPPIDVAVDSAFIFWIRDLPTGELLFIGRVSSL